MRFAGAMALHPRFRSININSIEATGRGATCSVVLGWGWGSYVVLAAGQTMLTQIPALDAHGTLDTVLSGQINGWNETTR